MITFKDAEKAWEYLRDTADEAASKASNYEAVEEYRKCVKADIMAKFNNLPVNAQEREAYSSQEYKDHLKAIEQAHFEHLKLQYLREAAKTKVSLFQTMAKMENI
jgi:hypothetical protein